MELQIAARPAQLRERRLTYRVERAWRSIAGDDRLPSLCEIEELDLGPDWGSCFSIDLSLSDAFPYFVYLGDKISSLALSESSAARSAPFKADRSILDSATAKMDIAALTKAPVHDSDRFILPSRRRALIRSVLCPLSTNGDDVSHIFGAVAGKIE